MKSDLIAPEKTKATQLVKLRAKRDVAVGERIITAGNEFECPEEIANELVKPIRGHLNGHGYGRPEYHDLSRAERI